MAKAGLARGAAGAPLPGAPTRPEVNGDFRTEGGVAVENEGVSEVEVEEELA